MATPKRRPVTARRNAAAAGREKVAAYRKRLRDQGLRPIQLWVPDTRSAAFRKAAHLQSALVGRSGQEADDQGFVDAASQWGDE